MTQPTAAPLPASAWAPQFRWVMLALVWLLYFSFGMTTSSLAPLVKTISRDLGISASLMGIVLGAWQLVYIFVAYRMGRLVDRLGPRRALFLGAAFVAASLTLRAAAVDFFSLFLIVALFGVGGSLVSVGAPKVVAVWFAGRERGMAAGMYTTAPLIGGIVVLATANSLVVPVTGHWRFAFLVYGGLAAVAAGVWWLLAREPVGQAARGHAESRSPAKEQGSEAPSVRALLRHRNVKLVLLLSFAAFFLSHGLNNWLPTVLMDKGMTPAHAGLWAALPSVVGIPTVLLIPTVTRYGYRAVAIAALLLLSAAATFGIGFLGVGGLLSGALVLSGASRWPLMPILTLVLMETRGIDARSMGTAGGMFFAVAEVGGFSGPFLMGLLNDLTGTLFSGLILLSVMAAALSVLALFIRERG